MRVTQANSPAAHQRRLVLAHRVLQYARQIAGREIAGCRRVRSVRSRKQVTDTGSVQRGNRVLFGEIKKRQSPIQLVAYPSTLLAR